MAQEFNSIPFFISIDVVGKSLDFNGFLDYLKSEHKKDVTVLNGLDFVDQTRGAAKTSSRSSRMGMYDSSPSIIKGMKAKIDSDLSKLESKKKQLAQSEKSRSHKSKSKSSQEQPKFEGKIDMLYLITNFPYLPGQLMNMKESGICIDAFFTIKPNHAIRFTPANSQEKLSAKSTLKKQAILGSELDFTLNPNAYPPARVVSLESSAPNDVSFIEIESCDNFESTFKKIESEIVKIIKIKSDFNAFIKNKNFIQLPSFKESADLRVLRNYLFFHPEDIVNSIYFQLKEGNWKRLCSPPPETKQQHFDHIFNEMYEQTRRKVVFIQPKEPPDPVFNAERGTFSIYEFIYPLLHWDVTKENAYSVPEIINFISDHDHLYTYAGSKFDTIVTTVNKKYSLSLPLNFFDWEHWNYAIDYVNITEAFSDAINSASVVETIFDNQAGLLFVLVFKPIPKTMGQVISNYSMPFCIQNITEYMNKVCISTNNETPNPKKNRNQLSPASIIREKLDPNLILPSIESRISHSTRNYRLPLNTCNCESFISPYPFENGLYVIIRRDLIYSQPTFSYNFLYKNIIEVTSTGDSILFQPIEGIRYSYDFKTHLTIFFNDQSLCFDGENIHMMTTNEKNIIVTKTGCLIYTDRHGINIIVYPNGSISRYIDDKWITIDKDGVSLDGVNRPHSSYFDDQTRAKHMVRSDNIEYTIFEDGKRFIVIDIDCTVEQNDSDKTVTFIIPNFPIIQCSEDKISFDIDRFNFIINTKNFENSDKLKFTFSAKTNGYSISINGKIASFETEDCEAVLSDNLCHFKNKLKNDPDEQYLIADSKGNEKICRLASEDQKNKKKVELYESKWGSLIPMKETIQEPLLTNLYNIFLPRFFVIRKDLSGLEFVRDDSIKTEKFDTRKLCFKLQNNKKLHIFTMHSMEMLPSLYIQFQGISKPLRANIMKDLHIPKPSTSSSSSNKKKNTQPTELLIENARSHYNEYLSECSLLSKALEDQLSIIQNNYIQENQPPEVAEEPPLIIPACTPSPRMLNMMYNLHKPKAPGKWIKDKTPIINYWECSESDFGYPIDCNRVPCKMLSPRLTLFDPPRNYKPENIDFCNQDNEAFVTQTERSVNKPNSITETKLNPKNINVKAMKDCIDFGDVAENKSYFASLKVQNTGQKPLHFYFTQDENDRAFRICSIPGIIFPGLQYTIRIELLPSTPKTIDQSFTFKTPYFEMKIPVKANAISEKR